MHVNRIAEPLTLLKANFGKGAKSLPDKISRKVFIKKTPGLKSHQLWPKSLWRESLYRKIQKGHSLQNKIYTVSIYEEKPRPKNQQASLPIQDCHQKTWKIFQTISQIKLPTNISRKPLPKKHSWKISTNIFKRNSTQNSPKKHLCNRKPRGISNKKRWRKKPDQKTKGTSLPQK